MARRPDDMDAAGDRTYQTDRAVERPKLKTSAAAVFSLVFGLSALFCALALFLSPLAVLFGIIALILGAVGISMAGRPNVTGKGVAIGGLVLGLLGLLLGVALVAGISTFLSNESNVQRIERQLDDIRGAVPTELPT